MPAFRMLMPMSFDDLGCVYANELGRCWSCQQAWTILVGPTHSKLDNPGHANEHPAIRMDVLMPTSQRHAQIFIAKADNCLENGSVIEICNTDNIVCAVNLSHDQGLDHAFGLLPILSVLSMILAKEAELRRKLSK